MPPTLTEELLQLNQRLLECIMSADWTTYQELCDPTLTAFEPEAVGQQVVGMAFHEFYFKLATPGVPPRAVTTSMASPQVRIIGDAAVLTYIRLTQRLDGDSPVTTAFEETRVWSKESGRWLHVHFHRSRVPLRFPA